MFHANVDGVDGSQDILDHVYQLLLDSFPSFSKVDRRLFEIEMTAMNLELFSLVFFKKYPDIDKAVQQAIFTLRYLQSKDGSKIWESVGAYNKTVGKTATIGKDGQHLSENTAFGRMTITRVNTFRYNLFEKWMKTHCKDPDNLTENEKEILNCVAHVCNHVEADILRYNQIGNRLLTGQFLFRIGAESLWGSNWTPSEDFALRAASNSLSMYETADKILKTVDLKFP
ncbi:MAG: hypothetical protein JW845_06690 [Dehalococcoidales bacterium]|nr:hypothetical protein [Dehalococcoidales bacterium]